MEKRYYKINLKTSKGIEPMYLAIKGKEVLVCKEPNMKSKIDLPGLVYELTPEEFDKEREQMRGIFVPSTMTLENKVYYEKEEKRIENLKKINERLPVLE